MSRRTPIIAALCLVLLLPASVVAQDDASAAPTATTSPTPSSQPASSAIPEVTPGAEVVAAKPAKAKKAKKDPPKADFRVGKWELQRLKWRELHLNSGSELPIVTVGPQDARSIPMRPLGLSGSLVYNPTVIAQQGMKRLDSYKSTGKAVHLRQARKYLDKLEELSDGGKKRRWQPHWYPYQDFKRGWVNANSHGLVLSLVSRFYRITGNEERLADGARLLAAYQQRPQNQRWFSDTTKRRYLWFEHWPDGRHKHTLNAHLNAMFGLYDYWHATGSPLAEQLFLGGAKTVRDKLDLFRRPGDLSSYSLGLDRGSLHYHETHIDQLRILAKMTGDKWFDRQADKFIKDGAEWKAKYRGNGAIGGR